MININYIREQIYDFFRKSIVKELTKNIGEIVFENDQITCYVDAKTFKDVFDINGPCQIFLNGTEMLQENIKEKFRLNTSINYVFNNVIFDRSITIETSDFTNLIIKNCTFNNGVNLKSDNILLNGNTYIVSSDVYLLRKKFLEVQSKCLSLVNEKFLNSYELQYGIKFGMDVQTNELKINNTVINMGNSGEMLIKADNINFNNSLIVSPKLYIESNNINYNNTKIFSSKKVMIENIFTYSISEITSPSILYNGLYFSTGDVINNETINLKQNKSKLYITLKNLSDTCNFIKFKELEKLNDQLSKQSVSKILKKSKKIIIFFQTNNYFF